MPWTHAEPICITVSGAPKPLERNRHRIVKPRSGVAFVATYLPTKSRNEQAVIRDYADRAMGGRSPIQGPVDLRCVAYMPVPASWSKKKQAAALSDMIRPDGRPDLDNILKNVCDAFKGIVWRDDTQVTETGIWKRYSDRPRTVIEVRALTWIPETISGQPRHYSAASRMSNSDGVDILRASASQ
jgi:Holliday junction resolvase RusA-like endonuclease